MVQGLSTAPEILNKSPNETRYAKMDFSSKMSDTETIASFGTPTVTPAGSLIADTLSIDGQEVQFRLTGGQDPVIYDVLIPINTSTGQLLEGVGRVQVGLP